jgi:hypothetical protein
MTITERIAAAVKPIIDDHNRESRERIGQLERDINEARAHLEVARTTCERLTKQTTQHDRPTQAQQDGPWCIVGCTLVKGASYYATEVPVAFESAAAGWSEDVALAFFDRATAEKTTIAPSLDVFSARVVPVVEWHRIVRAHRGTVTK